MKTYNPKRKNVIYVFDNDINSALRSLKHETQQMMKELKMKRYFEPKSAKRKRKLKEAIARERMRLKKMDPFQ